MLQVWQFSHDCRSSVVLCNAPLRSFVGLLWSFVGPLRSFAVFSHTPVICYNTLLYWSYTPTGHFLSGPSSDPSARHLLVRPLHRIYNSVISAYLVFIQSAYLFKCRWKLTCLINKRKWWWRHFRFLKMRTNGRRYSSLPVSLTTSHTNWNTSGSRNEMKIDYEVEVQYKPITSSNSYWSFTFGHPTFSAMLAT